MTLVRFVGRALFSAYFVADGYQSVTQPDRYVDEVERTLDAVLPRIKTYLPEGVADAVPEDMRVWTRILGGVQIAAGAGYALGIMRRPSAAILALTSVPPVVGSVPSRRVSRADRERTRGQFLRNLALFGAAVIATQDLEGRPSLGYRLTTQLPKSVDHSMTMFAKDAQLAKAQLTSSVTDARHAATKTLRDAKDAVL